MLFDPQSIFFPPYLLSSLLLILVWLKLAKNWQTKRALSYVFSRQFWWTPSSFLDLKLSLIFFFALRFVIVAVEASAFTYALELTGRTFSFAQKFPWQFALPSFIEGLMATLITMLAIDFASYAVHRLLHRLPRLWRIHAIHHSAENLTPLTTYRQHPLEPLFLYSARGFASGLALGLFHFIFPEQTPVITIFGLGAGFFFYMLTVNLHHAHVPVHLPRFLRRVLISPHIHHLHHSSDPRHFNSNYGVVFSFWDRLFGTYLEEDVEVGSLQFGLKQENSQTHSLRKSILQPFLK
jgi:sterol desaturase/sphingolipid hydroxylase (fatty acid hydroxylase superfamily)